MAGSEEQARKREKELDRIVFFSDAIFAIVMTLLVLDIEVPELPQGGAERDLPAELAALWPQIFSYILSFVVISTYWRAHHGTFRYIRDYDQILILLNLLFLMFVSFLPFPTALLGEYGEQQIAVILYACILAITRLLLTLIWLYAASGRKLISPDLDHRTIKILLIRGFTITAVFLLSVPVSFVSVSAAVYSWVLLAFVDIVFRMLPSMRRF